MPELSQPQLAELAGELQERGEREKFELARQLHDELGGLLTAAKMDVSWLRGRLAAIDDPELLPKLAQLEAGLVAAMQVKRTVVETLRPALLEHFGLPIALRALFEERCRRAGLELKAAIDEDLPRLSAEREIALYRIGEAGIANIVQHAQARRVDLTLQADSRELRLVVGDDGQGFTATEPRAGAAGILGMRHRLRRLGGRVTVRTAPGAGCLVTATVPLP